MHNDNEELPYVSVSPMTTLDITRNPWCDHRDWGCQNRPVSFVKRLGGVWSVACEEHGGRARCLKGPSEWGLDL